MATIEIWHLSSEAHEAIRDAVADGSLDLDKDPTIRWLTDNVDTKTSVALALLLGDAYVKAADVVIPDAMASSQETEDLLDLAFAATNSTEHECGSVPRRHWLQAYGDFVSATGLSLRSTGVGDLAVAPDGRIAWLGSHGWTLTARQFDATIGETSRQAPIDILARFTRTPGRVV